MAQNKWLQHVAQFRRNNKGMDPKSVMKNARRTYQSGGNGVTPYHKEGGVAHNAGVVKGGAVTSYDPAKTESTPLRLAGGRRSRRQSRRKSRRTRRR